MNKPPATGSGHAAHGEKSALYYPWFDWLRAICACAVMLHHDRVLRWEHAGSFAVQVFFALSGWLIGGMLLKLERRDLPRFFFNRAVRIWAPYYLAAALLLCLSILREPITAKWVEIVVYKLTFVYNLFGSPQLAQFREAMPQKGALSHFWSVNAEEQFYLVAPLLLSVIGFASGRSYAAIALFAGLAIPAPQNRWGALFGGMSYHLYLNHWLGHLRSTYSSRVCGTRRSTTSFRSLPT